MLKSIRCMIKAEALITKKIATIMPDFSKKCIVNQKEGITFAIGNICNNSGPK